MSFPLCEVSQAFVGMRSCLRACHTLLTAGNIRSPVSLQVVTCVPPHVLTHSSGLWRLNIATPATCSIGASCRRPTLTLIGYAALTTPKPTACLACTIVRVFVLRCATTAMHRRFGVHHHGLLRRAGHLRSLSVPHPLQPISLQMLCLRLHPPHCSTIQSPAARISWLVPTMHAS